MCEHWYYSTIEISRKLRLKTVICIQAAPFPFLLKFVHMMYLHQS